MSKSKKNSHQEKIKLGEIKASPVKKQARQNQGVDEARSDGSASGFTTTETVKE